MGPRTITQSQAVTLAVERLGGLATLAQLYTEVPLVQGCVWGTKTPQASIRRIVQFSKDLFKIKPGLYGLNTKRQEIEGRGIIPETQTNKNSLELKQSNHTYYQGLILLIGRIRRYESWAPNQDKNRAFLNQRISDLRTLKSIPSFSYPKFVNRCSTIDAVWFNDREMPHSLFEVEYSTDIQNSLLKFNELQDFSAKMVVVANKSRRKEFDAKVKLSAFKSICDRVKFLDFESLVKQYEFASNQEQHEVLL